jgi:hypothetical protein
MTAAEWIGAWWHDPPPRRSRPNMAAKTVIAQPALSGSAQSRLHRQDGWLRAVMPTMD